MIKKFDDIMFLKFVNSLNLNLNDFTLRQEYFDHFSEVHGINHTYRVMLNCLMIGYKIKDKINTKRAFMSAFIHDMARKHDNHCVMHGLNSSKYKLPVFRNIFIKNGMSDIDLNAIEMTVNNHCQRQEIPRDHQYYKTVAILRDADGLDLIRIDIPIKPEILRFKESVNLIFFAEELYLKTKYKKTDKFIDFLKITLN